MTAPSPDPCSAARTIVVALATGVSLSCVDSVQPQVNCTEIGCSSGLFVQLATAPAGAVKIEIVGSGPGSATYVFDCTASTCPSSAFFRSYFGADPLIRVTTSAGVKETQFHGVTYTVSHPNGTGCPPTCKHGSVTVPVPA